MANENNLDISKLLAEAGAEVDALIKAEKEKLEALKKSEESSMKKKEEMGKNKANGDVMKKEESSKEESSKEESSMKKDEGSGYESQAPEASDSQSTPPTDDKAPPQDGGQDQSQDLQSMVSSLDDEMLDELMQVVQMEKEARQAQHGGGAPGEQSQSQSAPPPTAPQQSPLAMAEKKALEERLVKAEKQAQELQKSFTSMTDLLDKMVNRPVQKAVTDVRQIDYIDKGENDLKKNESANMSDEDLKNRAIALSKDQKQLGALNKHEREVLTDFFISKKRSPELLKIVSK